jgi:hypothetical protein
MSRSADHVSAADTRRERARLSRSPWCAAIMQSRPRDPISWNRPAPPVFSPRNPRSSARKRRNAGPLGSASLGSAQGGTLRFFVSTENVREDEQFAYWREILCQAAMCLTPERDVPGPFAAWKRGRAFGGATISEGSAPRHSLIRTRGDLARMGVADYRRSAGRRSCVIQAL